MKKEKILMWILLSFLFIATIGMTYAWFTSSVLGNGSENIVTAGTLSIHYEDGPEIIMENMVPGASVEKTFTVTNTGTLDATYAIVWTKLINTIEKDELIYTLTLNDEEYSSVVPTEEENLKSGIEIKPEEKHEYKLVITFKETGEAQNYNQGKEFSAVINITDGSNSDVQIALKLNGKTVSELPSEGAYKLSSFTCVNGSKVTWNNVKRTYHIEGKQKDSCILDFENAQTIGDRLFTDNPNIKEDNVYLFAEVADEESESGLFRTTLLDRNEDTDGDGVGDTVYYFRGVVENNYLIFADHCWRVVRTNEGGESIKLRYGGTPTGGECPQTGTNVGINNSANTAYNSTANNAKYIGYTFDTNSNSTAKAAIDNWYIKNIENQGTNVTNLIVDEPYCNDQSGTTSAYGARTRLYTNKTPQYKCPQASDKYTVNAEIGNGKLAKPIALLTADEVAYAGGVWDKANSSFYLYTGVTYWTMSPFVFTGSNAGVFFVYSTGGLNNSTTLIAYALVPAISISAEALVADGSLGTYDHPYVIITE